jgi:hypothetical protein
MVAKVPSKAASKAKKPAKAKAKSPSATPAATQTATGPVRKGVVGKKDDASPPKPGIKSGLRVRSRKAEAEAEKTAKTTGASPAKKKGGKKAVNSKMRMCIRCPQPFEPIEESEMVCPKCKVHVSNRFNQLFGDEDPYSPQPTLRSNKIARVIIRKNENREDPEEDELDNAAADLPPVDRYDDD